MTDEQLTTARENIGEFARTLGYAPNLKFLTGYIEMLREAGVPEKSIDICISNCVINLSPDKPRVLQGVYDSLRDGGELYFSDVYADAEIPEAIRTHDVLLGECLAGALYTKEFESIAQTIGFARPRILAISHIEVHDAELKALVKNIKFYSITYRLFKVAENDQKEIARGQTATYLGTIAGHEDKYELDVDNVFARSVPVKVSANTAEILAKSWLSPFFAIEGIAADDGEELKTTSTESLMESALTASCCKPKQDSSGCCPPKQESSGCCKPKQDSSGCCPPKQESSGCCKPKQDSSGCCKPKQESSGCCKPKQDSSGCCKPKQESLESATLEKVPSKCSVPTAESQGNSPDTVRLSGSLVPRQYQMALFRQALENNTMIVLETGAGKTLVSVMLIEWFAQRSPEKMRVFLNNTVALVQQQARVISDNTQHRVEKFVGSAGIEAWGKSGWKAHWAKSTVQVMTHQIFLNALRHGYISLEDIDLLVIDECHHTRGNHPYALIMSEFYRLAEPSKRPHVFGMTASPLNSREDVRTSVTRLQALINADLCTVDLSLCKDIVSKAESICWEYSLPPEFPETELTAVLLKACGQNAKLADRFENAPYLLQLLGPMGVDLMWHHEIQKWHNSVLTEGLRQTSVLRRQEQSLVQFNRGAGSSACDIQIQSLRHKTLTAQESLGPRRQEVVELQSALAIDREFGGMEVARTMILQRLELLDNDANIEKAAKRLKALDGSSDGKPDTVDLRRPWSDVRHLLSPQVNALLDILMSWRDRVNELRGIVFVNRRLTAVALVYIVSQIAEFRFIIADALLGAARGGGKAVRPLRQGAIRIANQTTLADFAQGKVNLIFATQVAEEGVDVQPCNLVVRFEIPQTVTSLIQSRGRARKAGSQFYVMVPGMDEDINKSAIHKHMGTRMDYERLVEMERFLKDWCNSHMSRRASPTPITAKPGDDPDMELENDSESTKVVRIGRSGPEYWQFLQRHTLREFSADNPEDDEKELWIESRDRSGRVFTVLASGAKITYLSAIQIIYRYVQTLPQNQCDGLEPVYTITEELEEVEEEGSPAGSRSGSVVAGKKRKKTPPRTLFRCSLTLPANAALRRINGPAMPTKKLAKQVTSYRTAKKLHQVGAIDDNLLPVVEVKPNLSATIGKKTGPLPKGQTKGSRSAVNSYAIAIPEAFKRAAPASADQDAMEVDGNAPASNTSLWHFYWISLQHPKAEAPTSIMLATANPLPDDIAVPLYIAQYNDSADLSQEYIVPRYMWSRELDNAQIDDLASFTSKVMIRTLRHGYVWETNEVGILLAPLTTDCSSVDFEFARTCFKDRKAVYREGFDYSQLVGQLVMDALDSGNLKVVTKVCHDADVNTNLPQYHAMTSVLDDIDMAIEAKQQDPQMTAVDEHKAAVVMPPKGLTSTPCPPPSAVSVNMSTDTSGTPTSSAALAGTPKVSTRRRIKTMNEWSRNKRVRYMLPKEDEGAAGVPLLMVKPIDFSNNYLAPVQFHSPPVALSEGPGLETYPDGIYTTPFCCAREPLGLNDVLNLTLLSSFLTRLEQVLVAFGVKQRLSLSAKTETVRCAITASSSSMDCDYQRLETLGDSILKFITSTMLFVEHPADHEGLLTSRREHLVSNSHLFHLATRMSLAESIISLAFSKREWRLPGQGWKRLHDIPIKWICTPAVENNRVPRKAVAADPQEKVEDPGTVVSTSKVSSENKPYTTPHKETRDIITERLLSEKTVADIIESLLGAAVLDGGIEGALAAACSLNVADSRWTEWQQFGKAWHAGQREKRRRLAALHMHQLEYIASLKQTLLLLPSGTNDIEPLTQQLGEMMLDTTDVNCSAPDGSADDGISGLLSSLIKPPAGWEATVEHTLGYRFQDRAVLVEALTHCSMMDLNSASYQRLEYLGDAVLDYFVTKRYYNYKPELVPHRITLVKHVAVSNDVLGLILVCNGLHRFLRNQSQTVNAAIADYEERLRAVRQTVADAAAEDSSCPMADSTDVYQNLPPECWNLVPAPKVLGDLLESLLGAVYVDSGMDCGTAQALYEHLIEPFLDRFVDSGKLTLNPVIQSQLICQAWGCSAFTWVPLANEDTTDFVNRSVCEFQIHGRTIVHTRGEGPRHAKFNAACQFVHLVGAAAPNALDGNLATMHGIESGGKTMAILDELLKPLCRCKEERLARAKAEEEAKASLEAEASADIAVVAMTVDAE
ncbi:Dicer-like protein 1 [Linderina pennispora]|nr:Dicer-like protein 1 [Linderina pennispora]